MKDWHDFFTKRKDASYVYDIELAESTAQRAYMKRMAIDTCINFIARSFSQSEFRTLVDKKVDKESETFYKLNLRPNTDSSATDFWHKFIYQLIYENEVLVITTDTNDLMIADGFIRNEKALYPDTFTGVTVKGYQFKRSFSMDDVIYCNYNNKRLNSYTEGLFKDYGELFGRMIDINMRNNQIRGAVKVETTTGTQEDKQKNLQSYIDKILKSFSDKSVAIVPFTKGFSYEELGTASVSSNQSVEELKKLRDDSIDYVANVLGIPPALVHGQMAEVDQNKKAFIDYCLNPLIKKIEDELNAKLYSQYDFINAKKHIKIIGLGQVDMLDKSEAIDKLIASGAVSRNEVRDAFNKEPVEGGDEFVITKNYVTTKGGDNNENN